MDKFNHIECDKIIIELSLEPMIEALISNGKVIGLKTSIEPEDIIEGNKEKNLEYLSALHALFPYTNRAENINKQQLLRWINRHLKEAGSK